MSWRRYKKADIKTDVQVVSRREILDRNLFPCVDCGDRTYNRIGKVSGASWVGNIKRREVRVTRPGSRLYHYVSRQMMESPGQHNPNLKLNDPLVLGFRTTRCGRYFLANQTWDPTHE